MASGLKGPARAGDWVQVWVPGGKRYKGGCPQSPATLRDILSE